MNVDQQKCKKRSRYEFNEKDGTVSITQPSAKRQKRNIDKEPTPLISTNDIFSGGITDERHFRFVFERNKNETKDTAKKILDHLQNVMNIKTDDAIYVEVYAIGQFTPNEGIYQLALIQNVIDGLKANDFKITRQRFYELKGTNNKKDIEQLQKLKYECIDAKHSVHTIIEDNNKYLVYMPYAMIDTIDALLQKNWKLNRKKMTLILACDLSIWKGFDLDLNPYVANVNDNNLMHKKRISNDVTIHWFKNNLDAARNNKKKIVVIPRNDDKKTTDLPVGMKLEIYRLLNNRWVSAKIIKNYDNGVYLISCVDNNEKVKYYIDDCKYRYDEEEEEDLTQPPKKRRRKNRNININNIDIIKSTEQKSNYINAQTIEQQIHPQQTSPTQVMEHFHAINNNIYNEQQQQEHVQTVEQSLQSQSNPTFVMNLHNFHDNNHILRMQNVQQNNDIVNNNSFTCCTLLKVLLTTLCDYIWNWIGTKLTTVIERLKANAQWVKSELYRNGGIWVATIIAFALLPSFYRWTKY